MKCIWKFYIVKCIVNLYHLDDDETVLFSSESDLVFSRTHCVTSDHAIVSVHRTGCWLLIDELLKTFPAKNVVPTQKRTSNKIKYKIMLCNLKFPVIGIWSEYRYIKPVYNEIKKILQNFFPCSKYVQQFV